MTTLRPPPLITEGSKDAWSTHPDPTPSLRSRRRRRPPIWVIVAAAAVPVGAALWWAGVVDDRAGPSSSPATSAGSTPTTTVTAPTTTQLPAEAKPDGARLALWPFPGAPTAATPEEAARSFAVDYLGFIDPVFGELRADEPDRSADAGTVRSGSVPLRPKVTGPVTSILVQQLSGADGGATGAAGAGWVVTGAETANISLAEPAALAEITSPVRLLGRAHAFEGHVSVQVRQDGDFGPIGEGFVTGGGDVMRAFEGSVSFETPGEPFGSLILSTHSAEDGRIWEAAVVRVAFRSTDIDAVSCEGYRAPRPRATSDQMMVKVYFTCETDGDGWAFPVYRLAPRSPAVLGAALRALLAGPSDIERAASVSSWFSDRTTGLLRSVNLVDGHAVVDFTDLRRIIPNASSSAGSARLLAELDATVFQFRTVESVEYRIDGSCEAFNEWLQYGGCERRTRAVSTD